MLWDEKGQSPAAETCDWSTPQTVRRGEEAVFFGTDSASPPVRVGYLRANLCRPRGKRAQDDGPTTGSFDVRIALPDRPPFDHGITCSLPSSFPITFTFWRNVGGVVRRFGWQIEITWLARDGEHAVVRAAAISAPSDARLGDPATLDPEARAFVEWWATTFDGVILGPGHNAAPRDDVYLLPGFAITIDPDSTGAISVELARDVNDALYVRASGGCEYHSETWHGPYARDGETFTRAPVRP